MAYLHASSMYDGNEDEERVDEDDRNDEEENGVSLIPNDPERDEQESNESNQECNDSHHHQTHTQNVKVVKVNDEQLNLFYFNLNYSYLNDRLFLFHMPDLRFGHILGL